MKPFLKLRILAFLSTQRWKSRLLFKKAILWGAGCFLMSMLSIVFADDSSNLPLQKRTSGESKSRFILEFLHSELSSNMERIKTWKCDYDFTDTREVTALIDNAPLDHSEFTAADYPLMTKDLGTFRIVTDEKRNLFVETKCNSNEFRSLKSGKVVTDVATNLLFQRTILTDQMHLSFEPNIGAGKLLDFVGSKFPEKGPVAFLDHPAKGKRQQLGMLPDPRRFFYAGDQSFADECKKAAIFVETQRSNFDVSETARGFTTTVKLSSIRGDGEVTFLTDYDKNFGFNVTRREQLNGQSVVVNGYYIDYTKVEIADVFIPTKINYVDASEDGKNIVFQRLLVCKDFSINDLIDKDQFTYRALGMKDGDRFVNRIERIGFAVSNGELGEEVPFMSRRPRGRTQKKERSPWLLVGVSVILVITGIYAISRRFSFHSSR